jgi:hypothetical protein
VGQLPPKGPAQDLVQHSQLFVVAILATKFTDDFEKETLIHFLLDPL